MHTAAMDFCKRARDRYLHLPAMGVEFGAQNINGSARELWPGTLWTGVDLVPGPGVDIVGEAAKVVIPVIPDIVLCTEMFEHDKNWRLSLFTMCKKVLKSGGLFVMTCATEGRAEHGTHAHTPVDSPGTLDYYKNIFAWDFHDEIDDLGCFDSYILEVNGIDKDLYFAGVKS